MNKRDLKWFKKNNLYKQLYQEVEKDVIKSRTTLGLYMNGSLHSNVLKLMRKYCLYSLFAWCETEKGFNFWGDINLRLSNYNKRYDKKTNKTT